VPGRKVTFVMKGTIALTDFVKLRTIQNNSNNGNNNIGLTLDCFTIGSAWNKDNLGNLGNITLADFFEFRAIWNNSNNGNNGNINIRLFKSAWNKGNLWNIGTI
jgi:hypothetical protein